MIVLSTLVCGLIVLLLNENRRKIPPLLSD
uniref:Uncharacterized protein n=1 Tax=Anguilla anguilla TaxID=7936 RepID=A0A0E9Y2H1_ANGAN